MSENATTLKPLTEKQQKLLRRIREFIDRKGHAPTLDELAALIGKSRVTVYEHIKALAEKGYIRKDKYRKQGITLLHENPLEELRQTRRTLEELVKLCGGPKGFHSKIYHLVHNSPHAVTMSPKELEDTVFRLFASLCPSEPQPKEQS